MPEKVADYHGAVRVAAIERSASAKTTRVRVSFEEGMKLKLALEDGLLALNRLNRGTAEARAMGLELRIIEESGGTHSASIISRCIA